ncbi:hypothetical protein [Millisia brevis]|uniref:hypothetical protein n=1 Tax=Millisia brevis TaxID=264148 RepID=UPI000A6E0D39|nr:hypothetical protein [Millisia brevis]
MTNSEPTPNAPIDDQNAGTSTAPRRKRWLLVGGIAAGALVLVGGTAAAVTAINGTSTDTVLSSNGPSHGGHSAAATAAANVRTQVTQDAPAAADFINAKNAAVAAVGGTGTDSIEWHRGGFEVDVRQNDGTEQTVYVAADGTTQVRSDIDSPDRTPDPLLTDADIEPILASVTAHSSTAAVTDIGTSDDGAPFEVDIRDTDGTESELDLDAAYAITVVDVDRPDHDE